jgi:hypothetical protein
VFHEADATGDMLLDESALQGLFVQRGLMHGQREAVYDTLRALDSTGDGSVDFAEFLEILVTVKLRRAANTSLLQ